MYWLFKTEPSEFGIDDLAKAPAQTARWDGIRNYQARNYIRDQLALGDQVFLYHSQCKPPAVVGLATVVTPAYADPAQFDPRSPYYDAKATSESPRWYSLDICLTQRFPRELTLAQIKAMPALADIALLKQGRLSIVPIRPTEAAAILSQCQAALTQNHTPAL